MQSHPRILLLDLRLSWPSGFSCLPFPFPPPARPIYTLHSAPKVACILHSPFLSSFPIGSKSLHCICDSLGTEEGPTCPCPHYSCSTDPGLPIIPSCLCPESWKGPKLLLHAAPWALKGTTILADFGAQTLSFMTEKKEQGSQGN